MTHHGRILFASLRAVAAVILVSLPAGWGGSVRAQDAAKKATPPGREAPTEAFKRAYTLAPGEDLKRIVSPFPEGRAPQVAVLYYRQDGVGLGRGTRTFAGRGAKGFALVGLINHLLRVFPQDVEGEKGLLNVTVEGDFVLRSSLPLERQVELVSRVLRDECKIPVRLTLREVDRDVVVAKGRYSYRPTEGKKEGSVPEFDIYGATRPDDSGAGGGGGTFDEMLEWAGRFTQPNTRVVNEATGLPEGRVGWSLYARRVTDEKAQQEDHDKALIFEHLAEQTGLTFSFEERTVRVLFVEPDEKPGEKGSPPK